MVPALQRSFVINGEDSASISTESDSVLPNSRRLFNWVRSFFEELSLYFRNPAFLPSISASLLYFTVLNFAGQMITYLLSVGYTSTHIGIARTVSVMSEISATWIAPEVMTRIGPIRSGLWFISWQMIFLAVAGGIFWGSEQPLIAASGLVGGVILSRIGLRGFDLSTQIIVQEVRRIVCHLEQTNVSIADFVN
jgi:solute carrier family 40 (iron-regulated transporter), member 1